VTIARTNAAISRTQMASLCGREGKTRKRDNGSRLARKASPSELGSFPASFGEGHRLHR
jgi:hypothetical protein